MKKGFAPTYLFLIIVILITGFMISTVDIVRVTVNNSTTMNFENLNFDPITANDTALQMTQL